MDKIWIERANYMDLLLDLKHSKTAKNDIQNTLIQNNCVLNDIGYCPKIGIKKAIKQSIMLRIRKNQ